MPFRELKSLQESLQEPSSRERDIQLVIWEESIKRFNKKMRIDENGCWLYTGPRNRNGYGEFFLSFCNKRMRAHRFAYEVAKGSIPERMYCLHTCDIKHCVNPAHLYLGTHADNMRDRNIKGRLAHSERHGKTKLTMEQVIEIRERAELGATRRELADRFEVSPECIRDIANHRRWKYAPGPQSFI